MLPKNLTKKRRELKDSMLEILENRGMTEKVYSDKVEEYMQHWELYQKLLADIEDRGIIVEGGSRGPAENRSVALSVQVSRQMLAIFNALGFKDADFAPADDDEL